MPIPLRSRETTSGRRMAGARSLWRANGNAQLPIASDRAINNDTDAAGNEIKSIHTNPGPDQDAWDGFIVWNDGHVTRDGDVVTTRLSDETPNNNDELFFDTAAANDTLLDHDPDPLEY